MSVVRSGVVMLFGIAVAATSATAADRPQFSSGLAHEPFFVPPVRVGTVVLYDQYNSPASFDVTSQDFEAALDAFDNQAADDFVIPAGQTWSIEGVDVDGEYNGGGGPAASFHVFFYATAGSLPGTLACSRLANPFTAGPAAGDAVIPLTTPCVLGAGTYWVSVQARQDFGTNGQWFWQNRSVQTGNASAWQNPGGGLGTPCATWGVKTTCIPVQVGPDQVFRINGVIVPVELQDWSVED